MVAESRMAYWAARERIALETARMSSYAFSAEGSCRDASYCGYVATVMEGVASAGRRGRRCQSSSLMKGMKG